MRELDWRRYLDIDRARRHKKLVLRRTQLSLHRVLSKLASGAGYSEIKEKFQLNHSEIVAIHDYLDEILTSRNRLAFSGIMAHGSHQAPVAGHVVYGDTGTQIDVELGELSHTWKPRKSDLGERLPIYTISGEAEDSRQISFQMSGDISHTIADNKLKLEFSNPVARRINLSAQVEWPGCAGKLSVDYHLKGSLGGPCPCVISTKNFKICYQSRSDFSIAFSNHFSGNFVAEPTPDGALLGAEEWLTACDHAIDYLTWVLSFGLGRRVTWGSRRVFFVEGDQTEKENSQLIHEIIQFSHSSYSGRINAVHFLNLQPLFTAAALAFDRQSPDERQALTTAIAWYLSGDSVESKFLACAIALEHLAHVAINEGRNILGSSVFDRLRKGIEDKIEQLIEIELHKASAIKKEKDRTRTIERLSQAQRLLPSKIAEINRRSAEDQLYKLFEIFGAQHRDLGNLIGKFIERRNGITHRGRAIYIDDRPGDVIDRAAEEICTRIFLAIIDFRQNFEHPLKIRATALFAASAGLTPRATLYSGHRSTIDDLTYGAILIDQSTTIHDFNRMAVSFARSLEVDWPPTDSSVQDDVELLKRFLSWLNQLPEFAERISRISVLATLDEAFYFKVDRNRPEIRIGLLYSSSRTFWLLVDYEIK